MTVVVQCLANKLPSDQSKYLVTVKRAPFRRQKKGEYPVFRKEYREMYLRKNRKIYLVMGFTDMRKQINGLAQIAEAKKPKELLSGNYFVFLGKTKRVMKILYWDKTGFCLWTKRLEEDSFPWPKKRDGVMRTDRENFRLLLMGIDIFKKHTAKRYFAVY